MGHLYIDFKEAEKKVFREQTRFLSPQIKSELVQCRRELNDQKTRESLIARDADILECLLQAKEYLDNGYKGAKKFLEKAPDFLKTTHAKALWNQMRRWHSNSWWEDIVKFER
jgi:putative hydrolase of HD superfamily